MTIDEVKVQIAKHRDVLVSTQGELKRLIAVLEHMENEVDNARLSLETAIDELTTAVTDPES